MSLSSWLLGPRYITGFIHTPMLLLIKREILIMAVCRQNYTITNQKQPKGRPELHLSSQFYVLLLNLLHATLHHFPPQISTHSFHTELLLKLVQI